MGNKWNANTWHRQHARGYKRIPLRARPMLTLGVFGLLLLGTAAVTVAQETVGNRSLSDDQIGICHATGSEEQPFVYLVVARDGAEHGHHEQHADDEVDVDSPEDCGIDGPAAEPEGAEPAPGSEMDDCHEGHGNNTTDAPSLCDGDLAVNKTGRIEGEHIFFDVVVQSLGPAEADGAKLVDRLPDVGRPWNMTGEDAGDCWMVGREVRCDFGDVASGDERVVRFKALHCPHDCGDDITNTVIVHAANDANESNDRATTVLTIEDCPEDDWSWADEPTPSSTASPTPTTSTPAPTTTAPPASTAPSTSSAAPTTGSTATNNTTTPTNSSAPTNTTAPNGTASPEPTGNSTGNSTATPTNASTPAPTANTSEPEPAPASSDVRVRQRATQDHLGIAFVIEVTSIGDEDATNVLLQNTLPDVQRTWALSGQDAEDCTLDGRDLTCVFGDLEANASRVIELRAFTDKMACGEHLVNTVVVSADDDAVSSNNRSSASILARSC